MKRLLLLEKFGLFDASDEDDIHIVLDKIDIEGNCEVQIDLSGCMIGYSTHLLVDRVIEQLGSLGDLSKSLIIFVDFKMTRSLIVDTLFRQSSTVKLNNGDDVGEEEILTALHQQMKERGIQFKISIRNKEGAEIDNF